LKWLYTTYIVTTFSGLPSAAVYAFVYKYLIKALEDTIISILHGNVSHDHALWLTLGSDKHILGSFTMQPAHPADTCPPAAA
jgi:hypothetical protein